MIDTKELRRKLRSDDLIDHIDIHANVKPVLTELLDRLEAVERERDSYKFAFSEYSEKTEWVQQGINDGTVSAKYLCWHRADVLSDLLRAAEKERDDLRARIEAMERQEPVGKFTQHPSNGLWEQDGYGDNPEASPLYTLPGARLGPEDVMRDAERYRYLRARDDGTAGVGCWLEAKGRVCDRGWLYGAQLDSAIDSFIELLAAAPEAKP